MSITPRASSRAHARTRAHKLNRCFVACLNCSNGAFMHTRGSCLCNVQAVIPRTLTTSMLITRCGPGGVAPHTVPCTECTKQQAIYQNHEITCRAISLLHAKMKTRIARWIARMLGSHSEQGKKHITVLKSIKEKRG